MRHIRELTQKGDPRIAALLPKNLLDELKQTAKTNKRRPQDEVIRRLARTLRFPEAYAALEAQFAPIIAQAYATQGEQPCSKN